MEEPSLMEKRILWQREYEEVSYDSTSASEVLSLLIPSYFVRIALLEERLIKHGDIEVTQSEFELLPNVEQFKDMHVLCSEDIGALEMFTRKVDIYNVFGTKLTKDTAFGKVYANHAFIMHHIKNHLNIFEMDIVKVDGIANKYIIKIMEGK